MSIDLLSLSDMPAEPQAPAPAPAAGQTLTLQLRARPSAAAGAEPMGGTMAIRVLPPEPTASLNSRVAPADPAAFTITFR